MVPDDECEHCLPDCISTIYDTEVSSAPFFNCDHTNIGSSSMCQFSLDADQINPPLFIEEAMSQYKKDTEEVPEFLDKSGFFSNQRSSSFENSYKVITVFSKFWKVYIKILDMIKKV